jgi:hypothetical protein
MKPTISWLKDQQYIYAEDPKGKGSWLFVNELGEFFILLNGAFVAHEREDHYVKSRGLILLEACKDQSPSDYFESANLNGVEPFQVIYGNSSAISHFLWDGKNKHFNKLDFSQRLFFCSPTLYDVEQTSKLNNLFMNQQFDETDSELLIWKTHLLKQQEGGFFLDRQSFKTSSSTQLVLTQSKVFYTHLNHKDQEHTSFELNIATDIN